MTARSARLRRPVAALSAALAGLTVFALILLIAVCAPIVAPHPPLEQNLGDNFKPPAWKDGGVWRYPLGTDPLGRDLLSRLIYGARYSLAISIASVVLGAALVLIGGLICGATLPSRRGWTGPKHGKRSRPSVPPPRRPEPGRP